MSRAALVAGGKPIFLAIKKITKRNNNLKFYLHRMFKLKKQLHQIKKIIDNSGFHKFCSFQGTLFLYLN